MCKSLDPSPRDSVSGGFEWHLKIGISTKWPGDAGWLALSPGRREAHQLPAPCEVSRSKLGIVLRRADISVSRTCLLLFGEQRPAKMSFPEWYLLLERSSAVGHTSY